MSQSNALFVPNDNAQREIIKLELRDMIIAEIISDNSLLSVQIMIRFSFR